MDEAKLKASAQDISLDKDSHVLSELSLKGLIERDFTPVPLHAKMRELINAIAHSKRNIFPVVDQDGTLAGIIVLEDIREIMFDTSQYDILTVDQLMQKPIAVTDWHEEMSTIMEKFDKSGVWNIPVLENGKYLGFVSKSSIFSNILLEANH